VKLVSDMGFTRRAIVHACSSALNFIKLCRLILQLLFHVVTFFIYVTFQNTLMACSLNYVSNNEAYVYGVR
jgi:hypothetical protein